MKVCDFEIPLAVLMKIQVSALWRRVYCYVGSPYQHYGRKIACLQGSPRRNFSSWTKFKLVQNIGNIMQIYMAPLRFLNFF